MTMTDKFIPLSVPNLKGNEQKYVTNAVETEWVSTAGPYVDKFEEELAKYVGVTSAVSCQNGTSGLHTSLLVAGVERDDEVIVPTLTFIAAVNPVKYLGAEPVFMDCDDSLTMDAEKLEQFCKNECEFVDNKLINKSTNRHIKAIIVVHVFGNLTNMERIMAIAAEYNLRVIEDATEALGSYYTEGKYENKFAGTIGDFGVYSFNGNKIITTGGGGMIVAKDQNDQKYAKHLTTQAKSDTLYFLHDDIGYNYRMTNLQAALGLAQLETLEDFIKTKEANYLEYKRRIEAIEGLSLLPFKESIRANYWFYSVVIDESFGHSRDEIIQYMGDNSVQTRPIWGLIHNQLPYVESDAYEIEKAEYYVQNIINVPCSSNLTVEDVNRVCNLLENM